MVRVRPLQRDVDRKCQIPLDVNHRRSDLSWQRERQGEGDARLRETHPPPRLCPSRQVLTPNPNQRRSAAARGMVAASTAAASTASKAATTTTRGGWVLAARARWASAVASSEVIYSDWLTVFIPGGDGFAPRNREQLSDSWFCNAWMDRRSRKHDTRPFCAAIPSHGAHCKTETLVHNALQCIFFHTPPPPLGPA